MTDKEMAQTAADWALAQVGCPYSQAKRLQEGIFDCSSLVARAYSAQGKRWRYGGNAPTSNKEVYDDEFELLWPASYEEIGKKLGGKSVINLVKQPGDLQFLCTDSATSRSNRITHVAMIVSETKIVHARSTKHGVRMDAIDLYNGKICAAVRYNPSCALRLGMKGFRTLALQHALNGNGADITEDGEFGQKTQIAMMAFQKSIGLKEIGTTNPTMLAALNLDKKAHGIVTPPEQVGPLRSTVRVTGDSVHIRTGPSTEFVSVVVAHKGDLFEAVDANGWFPILLNGDVCWVSEKYSTAESILK